MKNLGSTDTAGRLLYAVLKSFPELASLSSEEIGMRMAVGIVKEFTEEKPPREELYNIVQAAMRYASMEAEREAAKPPVYGPDRSY